MTPPSHPLDAELLLEHSAWMRRLARTLVRDVERAEELSQETWLRLLERPPALQDRGAAGRGVPEPRLLHLPVDLPELLFVDAERFFDENGLSRREGFTDEFRVAVMPGKNEDEVDLRVGKQLAVIRRAVVEPEFPRDVLSAQAPRRRRRWWPGCRATPSSP